MTGPISEVATKLKTVAAMKRIPTTLAIFLWVFMVLSSFGGG
jgi:hypothetical protein